MKKQIVTACCFLGIFIGFSQNMVRGTVYSDNNKNGKQDRSEKGIPNVSITNGSDVVQTDAKGLFALPVSNDMIISVIKPSDYTFPLDANNLPRFFYVHKPEGSPKTKFEGVAPTGKLSKKLKFGLIPSDKQNDFSILVFGDPQPYTKEEVDFFSKGIVKELENCQDAVFGLSLGDLVGNDLDLFEPYKAVVKNIGLPWYNVMGNHDLNFDTKEDKWSDETYEAHFGPNNYAFNYGKVHFIVLDDILYPDPRDGKGYWGGLRPDQLEFVENDLKFVPKEHLVVLAFHIPLSEPGGDAFRDEDRNKLFQLLKEYPNTLSLSAHTHIQKQDFFGNDTGWLQAKNHHEYNVGTTSGDWYSGAFDENGVPVSTMRDGTPKGFAFIDFSGNEYKIRYKAAGKPKDYQMEIFAPKVVAKAKRTNAGVYVNFFMGSKNDEVMYRIDNNEWKLMSYIQAPDPSYVAQIIHWDQSETLIPGKRASNPVDCAHLWQGKVLSNLEPGEHTIEVKAKDMFGVVYLGSTTYRIEVPQVLN